MKFSCKTSELLQALQLASRAISGQQALPILSNILFEAKGETCSVSATDLELSVVTSFPAATESEGSVTVPAKAILNFAQYNQDPEVMLETGDGDRLKCASKRSKTLIAGESAAEYPTIAPVERKGGFSLEAHSLLDALNLMTFACAKSTLRPVLSGVYLRSQDGRLILAATDSYRLSEFVIPTPELTEDVACIIPVKVLDEVRTVLSGRKPSKKDSAEEGAKSEQPKPKGDVEVALSPQQIELDIGQTKFLSRLIEGRFPDYQQIIPKGDATTVMLSTQELTSAVKRMHYFAKEVNNNLTFTITAGQVHISTPQTQLGKDESTLGAEVNGKDTKIALSSSYLLDFLGHVDEENVEMKVTDSMHPALFRLPNRDRFLHLIMPLRMQD
jgi:DNA polymerase III subunit beta